MASSRGVFGSSLFSETVAAEFDAIGIVNDAIEDGIGQRRVADYLVPTVDRHLAGDHDGTGVLSALNDLQ